jgi:hypothetical protein
MSVGDNFTLVPLSNIFVRRSELPDLLPPPPPPPPPLIPIPPLISGRIENDGSNIQGNVTGNYTWYRLSIFSGNADTQGRELREYLLVLRGVSANASTGTAVFSLPIPEGGFNTTYEVFKLLYDSMSATTPGSGSHVWTASIPDQGVSIEIRTFVSFNPNNESFFFYVMGI